MIQLIRENYATYINTALGKPERHRPRLLIFAICALVFALLSPDAISGVYSMMATGITVLTGFTFTALFSDHALASSGLPKPRNENDRQDLIRLQILSKNFRARSSYFITLSILEILLLAAASFDFTIPEKVTSFATDIEWIQKFYQLEWLAWASFAIPVSATIFASIVNFIYLECLYTFYRMAETILAIVDTRRGYLTTEDHGER